jgi:hypothetical protein
VDSATLLLTGESVGMYMSPRAEKTSVRGLGRIVVSTGMRKKHCVHGVEMFV